LVHTQAPLSTPALALSGQAHSKSALIHYKGAVQGQAWSAVLSPAGQALQVPLESVQSKTSPAGEHLQISPATAVASASLQA